MSKDSTEKQEICLFLPSHGFSSGPSGTAIGDTRRSSMGCGRDNLCIRTVCPQTSTWNWTKNISEIKRSLGLQFQVMSKDNCISV